MAYTSVKISADSSSYQSQMKSAASQMKVLSAEYTTAATKANDIVNIGLHFILKNVRPYAAPCSEA